MALFWVVGVFNGPLCLQGMFFCAAAPSSAGLIAPVFVGTNVAALVLV